MRFMRNFAGHMLLFSSFALHRKPRDLKLRLAPRLPDACMAWLVAGSIVVALAIPGLAQTLSPLATPRPVQPARLGCVIPDRSGSLYGAILRLRGRSRKCE